jgi:hypothetical protein
LKPEKPLRLHIKSADLFTKNYNRNKRFGGVNEKGQIREVLRYPGGGGKKIWNSGNFI